MKNAQSVLNAGEFVDAVPPARHVDVA